VVTRQLQVERRTGKFAGQRPTLYGRATQPTPVVNASAYRRFRRTERVASLKFCIIADGCHGSLSPISTRSGVRGGGNCRQLAATLRWFTAGGAIRIAVRQLSQTWK